MNREKLENPIMKKNASKGHKSVQISIITYRFLHLKQKDKWEGTMYVIKTIG